MVVTLKYYKNPSHRTYEFKCCDAGLFGCSGGCEAYFKICVTKSASANTHSCNMGTTQTAVIGNRDDHRLNLRKEFAFTSLQEFVNLKVQVWDHDKILKDDLVETFFSSNKPWLPNHGHQKKTIRHKSRVVQLTLDLEVYCNKNYYGSHCTKQCVPGKTYTCGLLGEKVCRANWYGKSCTVECIPRDDWRGHYTCDKMGKKVCRSSYYGESCTRWCAPRDDPRDGHFNCDRQGNKICLPRWEGPSCKRCVKNWFGPGCSTHCVPQDSYELGHYKCSQSDGTKQCLPWWFGSDCKAHCIPHDDDDNGHYSCAREGNKTCHDGWHGENCTVFCIPQDDDIRGHYTCDEEGGKVCLNGYRSPDCMDCLLGLYGANCSLSCLVNDTYGFQQGYIYCSDDGVKQCKKWWHGPECLQYCVPHDDNEHGHYMCEPRDGSKVCRPGWEGLSCLNRKKN